MYSIDIQTVQNTKTAKPAEGTKNLLDLGAVAEHYAIKLGVNVSSLSIKDDVTVSNRKIIIKRIMEDISNGKEIVCYDPSGISTQSFLALDDNKTLIALGDINRWHNPNGYNEKMNIIALFNPSEDIYLDNLIKKFANKQKENWHSSVDFKQMAATYWLIRKITDSLGLCLDVTQLNIKQPETKNRKNFSYL